MSKFLLSVPETLDLKEMLNVKGGGNGDPGDITIECHGVSAITCTGTSAISK